MGRAFSFFAFCWVIITIVGGVAMGNNVPSASTELTADLTAAGTTINVETTNGFPTPGVLVIGDERIAYSATTANTFTGSIAQPMVRGTQDTDAVAHAEGADVRMVEGSMMNTAVTYNLAVIADASGLWAAVTIGLALLRILGSFLILPVSFLGTDLQIIGVLWWCMVAGMIISFGIALAGGRRV